MLPPTEKGGRTEEKPRRRLGSSLTHLGIGADPSRSFLRSTPPVVQAEGEVQNSWRQRRFSFPISFHQHTKSFFSIIIINLTLISLLHLQAKETYTIL